METITEDAILARTPKHVRDVLKQSTVCILGLGGIGSNCAVALARSGIGHLILVDFDSVELSNLNRQYYTLHHLGKLKTEALTDVIASINPFVKVTTHASRVTEENIMSFVGDANIVCEAFDTASMKATAITTLLRENEDILVVSASGMAGIGPAGEIETKQVWDRLYVCGDQTSDFEQVEGMVASRVAVCANQEAHQVIRLLLGLDQV